jgi:hypothetical protein
MTELECDAAVWFAQDAGDDEFDTVHIRRDLKFVTFCNPSDRGL